MADYDVDILIVGGGLMGACLMLALSNVGFRTLLIEQTPFLDNATANFDARSLALSPASVRILQMLNVWPLLYKWVTPIEKIHVSEQGCFGSAHLHGNPENPLGYVVEMQYISHALHQLLDPKQIITPGQLIALDANKGLATIARADRNVTVQAHLIVAADGSNSSARTLCGLKVRSKDYAQCAIVSNIGLARAHQQIAYERFTASGPLALLPLTDLRCALVWAVSPKEAQHLQTMPETEFLKTLQRAFGYRLGRFIRVGQRVTYPLRQIVISEQVVGKVVFVGNAAHTLHPVAGQGFNLGLRDVAMLAQCIAFDGLNSKALQRYEQSRRHDQTIITRLTDGLIELFSSQLPGLALARTIGLMAMDNSSVLKNTLARYARGFGGIIPDLVCGIALQGRNIDEPNI